MGKDLPGGATVTCGVADVARRHSSRIELRKFRNGILFLGLTFAAVAAQGPAMANGFGESRSWQFDTSADKANKAGVADLVERKKGGYYDGFTTVVNTYSTTNIGTQINCTNAANATGNIADNGQVGNSPNIDSGNSVDSSATGNDNSMNADGDQGGASSDQSNSGAINSDTSGNSVSGSTNAQMGGNDQVLNNSQNNSGDQTATVSDSQACSMPGSSFSGNVDSVVNGDGSGGQEN